MSFYSTVQGQINYAEVPFEVFAGVVQHLKTGGWVNESGYFQDECEDQIQESETPDVNVEEKYISIPLGYYRNFPATSVLFPPGAIGEMAWTSTDGCFQGCIVINGEETLYDLEEWAAAELEGEDATPPEENEEDDEWFQSYVDWQSNVEMEFHCDL